MTEINGNKIYCEITGSGIPVLTIHGFGVDHLLMKKFIDNIIIKNKYQIIYFDLPGMGKTIIKEQLYFAEEMYNIIKEFKKEVIDDKKYIVIGESYGAYLMQKLINDDNENIIGAMFLCPVIIPNTNERDVPARKIIHNAIKDKKTMGTEKYKSFIEMAVLSNKEIMKKYERSVLVGINRANEEYLELYQRNGYGFKNQTIEKFDRPVLFILGKQDHIVGYNDAFKILEKYSRASFCILDETGHNLQIEKSKIVKILVKDWLERIERSNTNR